MDRRQEILRYIPSGTRGIEIAPWHNPVVPRGGEREIVVVDVLDRAALIARSETMPEISKSMIADIGEVDLLGSACEIAELVRAHHGPDARFEFVVSSHNFEHLPDPVRFLRGCATVLAPGGVVAMAVPDKRACFDFFRPHSSTGEMLQAFHERRDKPAFAQIFSQAAYGAGLRDRDTFAAAFTVDENPADIALLGDAVQSYRAWRDRIESGDDQYHDTHCWAFTPASLELILTELILLGLIDFDIVSISEPWRFEFYVHLRKRLQDAPPPQALALKRESLLHLIYDETARCSRHNWALRAAASRLENPNPKPVAVAPEPYGLPRRVRDGIRRRLGV